MSDVPGDTLTAPLVLDHQPSDIVVACGALVEDNEVGRGSSFHFTAPCSGHNLNRPPYSPLGVHTAPSIFPINRLLLLTPNPIIARLLLYITSGWGITSLCTESCAEALLLMQGQQRGSFQAILIDHRVLVEDESVTATRRLYVKGNRNEE